MTDRQRVHRVFRVARAQGIRARLSLRPGARDAVRAGDRWAYAQRDWERARWSHPYDGDYLIEDLAVWCDGADTAQLLAGLAGEVGLRAAVRRLDGQPCVLLLGAGSPARSACV